MVEISELQMSFKIGINQNLKISHDRFLQTLEFIAVYMAQW